MTEIIADNMFLVILLPLWVFLIVMLGRFFSVYVNKFIIYILTLCGSFLGSVFSIILYCLLSPDKVYEYTLPFIKINDFIISYGIHIDKLSLIFTSILFLVSFFIQIFSISYMKEEIKQYRFFALINMFNFTLAALFFSPNLFQTYVFWEIAGVLSYLLIGFEYFKTNKSIASKKVFIINRIGDTALISGIIMCSYLMYEYAPAKSLAQLSFPDIDTISLLVSVYTSPFLLIVICGLFIIAALVKSAQFPFYTWLQDAMEAKLPVSALLHSATLVALGIYLIIRLMPLFILEPILLKYVAYFGLITTLICSLSACAQRNPKKTLAYSTSAQMGLIIFSLSTLNIKAGIALFCAHAIIKSLLFITLPDKNTKWNFIKFILFIIGGLSLSGIILSGLISKEMAVYPLKENYQILLSLFSFLTAFYIARITVVVAEENTLEKSSCKKTELFSAIGLIILDILLCLHLIINTDLKLTGPFYAGVTAWIIIYILYFKHSFKKIPYIYSLCFNGFYVDKFYTTVITDIYNKFSVFCGKFDTVILSNYSSLIFLSKIAVKCVYIIEKNVIDKTVINIAGIVRKLSAINIKYQNKNIQRYNFYAFIIITVILTCIVIAYSAIMTFIKGVS